MMLKVNKLNAHDRLQSFQKSDFSIGECCADLIKQRPFGENPFYIFSHARTDDDGVTKRLIWQPRLTKPKSQTNSMLFKAYPGSDNIKVIWMIPERSMWSQFNKGMLCESKLVADSIFDFVNNREKLEAPEKDDLSDDRISAIYKSISVRSRVSALKSQ